MRLTFWYLVTLTLIMLVFSALTYWQARSSVLEQMDSTLRLATQQAIVSVTINDAPMFTNATILLSALDQIDDDLTLQLVGTDGTIYQSLSNARDDDDVFPVISLEQEAQTVHSLTNQSWRVYSQPVAGDTWIQAGQSLDAIEDNLEELLVQMAWGLPVALLIAGAGGYLLAGSALRPVDRMTRTAQAITGSDLSQRIGYDGVQDEIGRLATTFDTMLNRLDGAFQRERRFTSDAAHELRTPLTALKGNIDVALGQPRSAESYRQTLTKMNGQVDRLIQLTKELLFMARLDPQQINDEQELIDLPEFLPTLVDFVRPLADEKGIELQEHVPLLAVSGYPDLLIQCFLNLLDNAIKYTPSNGTVMLEAQAVAGGVEISVRDSGSGVAPDDIPLLFERFFRVDKSRARINGQGGNGLGLAIVKQIVELHSGTISVESTLHAGSTFTIFLPQS